MLISLCLWRSSRRLHPGQHRHLCCQYIQRKLTNMLFNCRTPIFKSAMSVHMNLSISKWILLRMELQMDVIVVPPIRVVTLLRNLNKPKEYWILQGKRTSKILLIIKVATIPPKCKEWMLWITSLTLLEISLILRMKVGKNLNSLKLQILEINRSKMTKIHRNMKIQMEIITESNQHYNLSQKITTTPTIAQRCLTWFVEWTDISSMGRIGSSCRNCRKW